MFICFSDRRFKAALRRLCALALIVAAVFCLCACKGSGAGPEPTESEINPATELPASLDGTVTPTEAQTERILRLAAAFRQFGDYSEGTLTFSKLEHIIFCMYTDSEELEECHREGFGKLSKEKADDALKGVFGNIEIYDVMRRGYDSGEEQTYYFADDVYYIMRTDNSAYSYSLVSVKEYEDENGRTCHAAIVSVLKNGKNEMDIIFSLIPDDVYVYRVSACDISLWY